MFMRTTLGDLFNRCFLEMRPHTTNVRNHLRASVHGRLLQQEPNYGRLRGRVLWKSFFRVRAPTKEWEARAEKVWRVNSSLV